MKKNILFALTMAVLLQSCLVKAVMKHVGIYDEANVIKKISNGKKDICFMPMHHIGKQSFYDDTKAKMDSLSKSGYFIFFEGIKGKDMVNNELKDTLLRKFRRLTGIDMVKMGKAGGYVDTISNVSIFQNPLIDKRIKKDKLVNQPLSLIKMQDTMLGKGVDASLIDLISNYERKYGTIQLKDYDYEIKLGSYDQKYTHHKISKEQRSYLIDDIRNQVIANEIVSSKYSKIVLVYGKAHYDGILDNLKQIDNTFSEVN